MKFDKDNINRAPVIKDRLSILPDEIIHKILSFLETKFAVQTCLLSRRWKPLWKSVPCLNLNTDYFGCSAKFSMFVYHVLNHRNHDVEVSSLKLRFPGAASQDYVIKIVTYAFAHNVQELSVSSPQNWDKFPTCLFSSPSLKHLTFIAPSSTHCLIPTTPWNFPALTTLYLCHDAPCINDTEDFVDLFSKCVSLKNLTLKDFRLDSVDFEITSPQLSNLTLHSFICSEGVNLITPQLKILTIINSHMKYLNAPPGLSTFNYSNPLPLILPKYHFHSLNEANVHLHMYRPRWSYSYTEGQARHVIKCLQDFNSARFLTLNIDIVECLSAFPEVLSHHPSPFSNLIRLNIDSSKRKDTYNFKLSTEAKTFFLGNSPNSTFIMELPEKPA